MAEPMHRISMVVSNVDCNLGRWTEPSKLAASWLDNASLQGCRHSASFAKLEPGEKSWGQMAKKSKMQ